MCYSHPVPKVFISLRLLLFRYESHIQNQTFPFLFLFFSLWNERHILFHSESKDTSYTPTIPFLSFKLIHFQSEKYLFSDCFIPFRLFYWCPIIMGFAGGKNTTYTPAIPPSKYTIYFPAIPREFFFFSLPHFHKKNRQSTLYKLKKSLWTWLRIQETAPSPQPFFRNLRPNLTLSQN